MKAQLARISSSRHALHCVWFSWCWSGAFSPAPGSPPLRESTSGFAYPVRNPAKARGAAGADERHNPSSIATLRRQISTHLARSLPRCPAAARLLVTQ